MGNAGAREEYALPASDKVTAVLFIYTVKSGKSMCSDRGKKQMYEQNKIFIIIWDMDISIRSTRSWWRPKNFYDDKQIDIG